MTTILDFFEAQKTCPVPNCEGCEWTRQTLRTLTGIPTSEQLDAAIEASDSVQFNALIDSAQEEAERLFAIALMVGLYLASTRLESGKFVVNQALAVGFCTHTLMRAVRRTGIQMPVALAGIQPDAPPPGALVPLGVKVPTRNDLN